MLNKDLIFKIIEYLPIQHTIKYLSISRSYYELKKSNYLWCYLLYRDYKIKTKRLPMNVYKKCLSFQIQNEDKFWKIIEDWKVSNKSIRLFLLSYNYDERLWIDLWFEKIFSNLKKMFGIVRKKHCFDFKTKYYYNLILKGKEIYYNIFYIFYHLYDEDDHTFRYPYRSYELFNLLDSFLKYYSENLKYEYNLDIPFNKESILNLEFLEKSVLNNLRNTVSITIAKAFNLNEEIIYKKIQSQKNINVL